MTAAIYARKSTEQAGTADEQKSVSRQVDHARQYAARKGWTVDETQIYVDDGISGAEFANRPGFLRLMNALKPRAAFQVLVMSEESRLGREAIETAYALKQLVQAGVRVFFYLEDRERTLDSPTDKIMLSLTTFADELEREKARQRTYDAMQRKARAGHVTGGSCFGYRNVDVAGANGDRSHVSRTVEPVEAEVIRRIFRLSAEGRGFKSIAITLNEAGSPSPRSQQGRPRSWAPSSVREVLFRPLYRGEIVWNRTRKRDRWGQRRQTDQPESAWMRLPAPELRIVTDDEWTAAHARLSAARAIYLSGTGGRVHGRPALGNPSKYLLTNLATCGECGGPLKVRSRSHGKGRRHFYGCAWHHERGPVCRNGQDVPMADADEIVIEALLDEVLTPEILGDAVSEAVSLIYGPSLDVKSAHALTRQIAKLEQERDRYIAAIGSGGELSGLLAALKDRERQLAALRAQLVEAPAQRPERDPSQLRRELTDLANEWRRVLSADAPNARPIIAALLKGRVTFTPVEKRKWRMSGEGTLTGLFSSVLSLGLASPPGFDTSGMPFDRTFRAA